MEDTMKGQDWEAILKSIWTKLNYRGKRGTSLISFMLPRREEE